MKRRSVVGRLMCLMALVFFVATTKAQINLNTKISIKAVQLSVPEVLKALEVEYDFFFAYNSTYFMAADKVSINKEKSSLKSVLNELLSSKYDYKVIGNHIILVPKEDVVLPQQTIFNGYVTDLSGSPLDSVVMYAVKDQRACVSDATGYGTMVLKDQSQFISLSHPRCNDTLIYVGNLQNEIKIQLPLKHVRSVTIEAVKLNRRDVSLNATKIVFNDIALVSRLVSNEQIYIANSIKTQLYMPVQLSFLPKVSTNALVSGLRVNCFSINVLAGYSLGVSGVEVGGVANIIQADVNGMQAAGIVNIVNGATNGFQAAGVVNYNLDQVNGVQVGGVGNIAHKYVNGFQCGGVSNYSREAVKGGQIAGVNNVNRKGLVGFQAAGVTNVSNGVAGVQIAGVTNFSREVLVGFQAAGVCNVSSDITGVEIASLYNRAQTVNGVQLTGLLNQCQQLNGLQLGLVNIADNVESGFQLGLFNIVKDGYRAFELTSSECYSLDFFYKTGGDKLYSVLNVGMNKKDVGFGYGLGITQSIYKGFSTSIEGISTAMLDDNNSDSKTLYVGQKSTVRLALNFDFFKQYGITTGLSWNHFKPSTYEEGISVSEGVSFSQNSRTLISKSIASGNNAMWFACFVGIRL